jgi:hypothetical protein
MPAPEKAKSSLTSREKKAGTEAKDGGEAKSAAIEESALKTPKTDAGGKETAREEVVGYYIVKKGETLSGIAAREDVYGDSLKWPILYQLNLDKLGKLQLAEDLADTEVPGGVRLKIVSPDEMRENLESIGYDVWAVNVLSGTTNGQVIPAAIRLIRNGYPVYITRVNLKGKDWMRLRVGFFGNRTDANEEGKKIMTVLNLTDSWITKVGKQELEEFGGYGVHMGLRSQHLTY